MLLLAPLALATPHLHAQAPSKGTWVLQDARVVPVSGPALEHGTVIVRDGLIEAVGANLPAPKDGWVIDCKGLTIYPGLIDGLSNWGLTNTPAPVAQQPQTQSRGPEDRPSTASWIKAADQLFPNDRAIQANRNGGFTSAVTFPTGSIFSGQGSVINLAGERAGDMVLADAVGQHISLRTAGFRSYPGSLMGTIAYIRQLYLDADRYKLGKSIYEKHPQGLQRPAYDRALEGVLASPRILLPATRNVEVERMITFAKELKVNAILYGGHEAWRSIDVLKQAGTPGLVSLRYPEKVADSDPALDEAERILELRDKAPTAAGALAKGGIKFAFYSDGVATPREIKAAVKKAIDAGLDPAAALRALTLSPAEIFGVSDRIGSIEKGKIANLVIADGDLFATSTKVKYVFVDGGRYEPPVEDAPARPNFGGRGGGRGGPVQ
jgi:imidazolonepropionase-like amidohydrolase